MRHVVLNFHGIGTPKRQLEPGEAQYWITPEMFAATLELIEMVSNDVDVAITFDDGNLSDIEIAEPFLCKAGRKATFFVLSNRIDTEGSLGTKEIRALLKGGHLIGSHGADHVDWRKLDPTGETREWDEARKVLSKVADQDIKDAAIPFGRYRGRVIRGLTRRGYRRIYSSDGGAVRAGAVPIPRTSLRSDTTLEQVEHVLLGKEPFTKRVKRDLKSVIKRYF